MISPRLIDRQTLLPLAFILAIGTPIAAYAPFDAGFAAATFGSPWLQMGLFIMLAVTGTLLGKQSGFTLRAQGSFSPVLVALGAALAVAVAIAFIDGVLWRDHLPASYLALFRSDLLARTLGFMMRAFNENVLYRLFLFSSLVFGLSQLWKHDDGRPHTAVIWMAAIASPAINTLLNVVLISPDGWGAAQLSYDVVRFIAPGVVWVHLYRRHGFITAEIASVSCQLLLQPMLGYLLG